MKNMLSIRLIRLILAISVVSFLGTTCDDNEEPVPDYVGKWVAEKPIAVAHGYVTIKYYLELTNDGFKETFLRPPQNSHSDGDQLTLEGTVYATGKTVKLVIHKLSVSKYDLSSGIASAPHETHTYTDQDFGFNFEGMINSISNHQSEYSLIDGKLTFKTDFNGDGIYDEQDKSVYTKQL